jgi:hypothetical protein
MKNPSNLVALRLEGMVWEIYLSLLTMLARLGVSLEEVYL